MARLPPAGGAGRAPPALGAAQAFPNKNIIPDHTRFLNIVDAVRLPGQDDPVAAIGDLPRFCAQILGWSREELVGTEEGGPLPDSLEVTLPEYNETLRPTFAVREPVADAKGEQPWMMLIQEVATGLDLDDAPDVGDHRWQASPQSRFERLYARRRYRSASCRTARACGWSTYPGETSGHLTFPVQAMVEVAGRPIIAAFLMLFSFKRLFLLSDKQRLPAILSDSRKYQNLVSTQLAEQVLAALYELVRGFQSADDQRRGDLLREVLADDPNHVYAGLLTVLMRLVFVLYAEDRNLLSNDEVYQKYYSVTGLFERLREDAGRHTDTMDHRDGAWAQLLTLFRLIHDGGRHGGVKLLAKGLPVRSRSLSVSGGSPEGSKRQPGERIDPPLVPDGVVFRALTSCSSSTASGCSYRTLDVEQIGSVYETMMGFKLESGPRPVGRHQGRRRPTAHRRRSTSRSCSSRSPPNARSGFSSRPTRKSPGRPDGTEGSRDGRGRGGRWRRRWPRPPRPASFRRGRWCSSRATNAANLVLTTPRVAHRADRPDIIRPILERLGNHRSRSRFST